MTALRALALVACIGVASMADFGIGEAAAVEGAKAAGEAGAAEAALGAGAAEAAGGAGLGYGGATAAEIAGAGAGTSATLAPLAAEGGYYGALGAGTGATAGMTAAELGATGGAGLGYGGAPTASDTLGTGAMPGAAEGGYYGMGAPGVGAFESGLGAGVGAGAVGTGAPTGATADVLPDTSPTAPVGSGGAGIPGTPDPLTAPASAAPPTGAPTGSPEGGYYGGGSPGGSTAPLQASPIPQSTMDQILAAGKGALPYANLGLGTASVIQQARAGSAAQKQMNAIGGPAKGVSNQLLQNFQSGQLTGADSFAIADWTQKQKAQTDQYFQKAGLSNSSMHQQALSQIDKQADGMRQQALDSMLRQGLGAAGMSDPTLRAGVTAGVQSDAVAMKEMREFLKMMAQMNTPQPAPTGTPGR